jgi:hypothetical protein
VHYALVFEGEAGLLDANQVVARDFALTLSAQLLDHL